MRALYVDCDNTLLRSGRIVEPVAAAIREALRRGTDVVIWSARGREHAETVARMAGVFDCVICVCKPDAIIDDVGWSWVRYARVLSAEDVAQLGERNGEQ
jgi:hydroxymethylpyrimidine pyrophosphatase-like HAD family hydrolase